MASEDNEEEVKAQDVNAWDMEAWKSLFSGGGWMAFWSVQIISSLYGSVLGTLSTDIITRDISGGFDPCLQGTPKYSHEKCANAQTEMSNFGLVFGQISSIWVFLFGPIVLQASDYLGRRPFMVYTYVINFLTMCTLLVMTYHPIPIFNYYLINELAVLIPAGVAASLWITDSTTSAERIYMMAISEVIAPIGISSSVIVSHAVSSAEHRLFFCLGFASIATLIGIFGMKESLPPHKRSPNLFGGETSNPFGLEVWKTRLGTIKQLWSHPSLRPVTLVTLIGMVGDGVTSVVQQQYLKEKFGMGSVDFADLQVPSFAGSVFAFTFLLPKLMASVGLKGIFFFNFMLICIKNIAWVFASSKTHALAVTFLDSFTGLSSPAVTFLWADVATKQGDLGLTMGAKASLFMLPGFIGPPIGTALFNFMQPYLDSQMIVGAMLNGVAAIIVLQTPWHTYPDVAWKVGI